MIDDARNHPDSTAGNEVADHPSQAGNGSYVMAADALEGDTVVNSDGEKLGTVERIIVDVPGGRIAYAVLSIGGNTLLPIPWSALTPKPESGGFLLDASKDHLEQAPRFDKDHWPTMSDADWAREVHTHYRALPYYWS